MDPISVSSGVLTLLAFAFKSTVTLYTTVRSFRSQDRDIRALRDELSDLSKVLESLQETASGYAAVDLDGLKLPLFRCGKACEEYGEIIARCTKHSDGSRPSVRDWVTQKYLQGDITQFRDMLAGYKSTINVAVAHANLRVSALTPAVLEDYKDMVRDTNQDLKEHMQRLDEAIQRLVSEKAPAPAEGDAEWQALSEEKESTRQGLRICAQLSSQIDKVVSAHQQQRSQTPRLPEAPRFPLAHQYITDGLHMTNTSIQALVRKLQEHQDEIDKRLEALNLTAQSPGNASLQLAQLQETKESIRQCINVVSSANETAEIERRNVFEDITMADDAYDFSVSTIGDLVTARRIHLTGRSRHIGGQLSSSDYQATIDAIKMVDLQHHGGTQGCKEEHNRQPPTSRDHREDGNDKSTKLEGNATRGEGSRFSSRYGRGHQLPADLQDEENQTRPGQARIVQ